MALGGHGGRVSLARSKAAHRVHVAEILSRTDDLTIAENLDFFLVCLRRYAQGPSGKDALDTLVSGLDGRQGQMTGSLPGRLEAARCLGSAIMHEPSVLFLDEPTFWRRSLARPSFLVDD